MQKPKDKILSRIYGNAWGWTFSGKDFLDVAGRAAIDQALRRLCTLGTIRKLTRGLYDYPRTSKMLGMQAPPDLHQVAKALARRRGWRIQASGPWAANLMGVSTQVPAKIVYLTDGPRFEIKIGNSVILFKPTARKDLHDDACGLAIQALKALGESNVDDAVISKIGRRLTAVQRGRLIRDKYLTGWVYEAFKRLCAEKKEDIE